MPLGSRLAVWIDAHETPLHNCGQHEHLHELTEGVLGESGHDQVGRWPSRFGVRLIDAL